MLFTFGPQTGQLLCFRSSPPPSSDKHKEGRELSRPPPQMMERTEHNTPSPYRILQFSSHQTFMSLANDSSLENVLRCSQEYRRQLRDTDLLLGDIVTDLDSEDHNEDVTPLLPPPLLPSEIQLKRSLSRGSSVELTADDQLMANLENMTAYVQLTEIVWNLIELLHLESSSQHVAHHVVDWVQKFEEFVLGHIYPIYPDEFDHFLEETQRKDVPDDELFSVRYYVIHGRAADAVRACNTLKRNGGMPSSSVPHLDELIQLISSKENIFSYTKGSARISQRKQQDKDWENWKRQVYVAKQNAAEDAQDTVTQGIVWILELMLEGENKQREKDHEMNRTWMSDLLLQLSYNHPRAVSHEIIRLMHGCLEVEDSFQDTQLLERYQQLRVLVRECLYPSRIPVVLAYLDREGHNVIEISISESENVPGVPGGITFPWSVAHLSDVLLKRGGILLEEVPVDSVVDAKPELAKLALEQSPNIRDMCVFCVVFISAFCFLLFFFSFFFFFALFC